MQGDPAIYTKAKMSLDIINNEIVEAEYKIHHILTIVLGGNTKVTHDNKCQTYCERISQLEKQGGQVFSMIRVQ